MAINTQSVYTGTIVSWNARLTNQVSPRKIVDTTPVLLGSTGDYGLLIYNIRLLHLGNNVASVCRFYTRSNTSTSADDYRLLGEMDWTEMSTATDTVKVDPIDANTEGMLYQVPLFDGTVKAIHLEKNLNLYCALGTAIASGIDVFVHGGLYTFDS